MKTKPEIIDHAFQESFEDFAPRPSINVWEGLQEQLLVKQAQDREDKRLRYVFFLLFGLLVFGNLAFWGMYFKSEGEKTVSDDGQLIVKEKAGDFDLENTRPNSFNLSTSITEEDKDLNPLTSILNTKTIKKQTPLRNTFEIKKIENNNTSISDSFSNKNYETIKEEGAIHKTPRVNIEQTQTSFLKLDLLNLAKLKVSETQLVLNSFPPQKPSFLSRLSLAPYIAGSNFNRILKNNKAVSGNSKEFFNQHESKSSSLSYGLKLGMGLKKGWRIETALSLIQFQMQTDYTISGLFKENAPLESIIFTSFNTNNIQYYLTNTSNITENDLVSIDGSLEQQIQWLNIPVMIGYGIEKGKFGLNVSAGMAASFFLKSQLKLTKQHSQIKDFQHTFSENSGTTHLSYRGEINLKYRSNIRDTYFLGMHIQNALTSANTGKKVFFYPQIFGWQCGMERRF